jgi:hypothetical protein
MTNNGTLTVPGFVEALVFPHFSGVALLDSVLPNQ